MYGMYMYHYHEGISDRSSLRLHGTLFNNYIPYPFRSEHFRDLTVRLVRFQQKMGENRIGVMIGADHVTEITGAKASSEPLLDFLRDPKAESKAQLAADSAKKHFDGGKQNEKGYWNLNSVTVLPPI